MHAKTSGVKKATKKLAPSHSHGAAPNLKALPTFATA